MTSSGALGPLDLLVLQPTPFCNLDCSYCYLPDRASTRRMGDETLARIFERVFESDIVRDSFTVVWHAGEPMVLPPSWYERAFDLIARLKPAGLGVAHSFQTNATLVDDAWCDLIEAHGIRVGVSVDGPDFLHDRCRATRNGKGTHARVMEGMAELQRRRIPFHVITVLTRASLDYADELYAFYVDSGIEHVGFNIEEIEGPNEGSSLTAADAEASFRRFMRRFCDLVESGGGALHVRELDSTLGTLLYDGDRTAFHLQETTPFAILSVDCDGNFTTFSPELLGLRSERYGDFVLGNAHTHTLAAAAASPAFARLHRDVAAGVDACRRTCAYFDFCGGGAPVNKLCENGSFDSTETLFCRLNRKALADVLLDRLLASPASPAAEEG